MAKKQSSKNLLAANRAAERELIKQLRNVAKVVSGIVNANVDDVGEMQRALRRYAERLGPWATEVVDRVLRRVNQKNMRALSSVVSKELKQVVENTPVGDTMRLLVRSQVELIKSLPLEAGIRAQKLAEQAATGGKRAAEVAEEIMRTEQVTESRAMLIARTEIAKANAALTQARAQSVGATHYIWRTVGDGDVRDSHAAMEGKVFAYADPPYVEGEGNHHPGEFPNCRCYAEPIIPDIE